VIRACLFVSAEKPNHCVGEILPSLQIFRHPSIPLRNCSVHVRDIELARLGQFGVFLGLFPIVLCWLRSGLHSQIPLLTHLTFNSGMGHRDEGDGAKAGLNWARRAAADADVLCLVSGYGQEITVGRKASREGGQAGAYGRRPCYQAIAPLS
jgi:hypothetical protein